MERKIVHSHGYWHRTRHIHPINSQKQTIFFQLRDASKDLYPMLLDTAAAGHNAAGESAEDALRELYEELGIQIERINQSHVKLFGKNLKNPMDGLLIDILSPHISIHEQTHPKVMDYEIQDVSFLDSPLSVDDFDLDIKEVFAIVEFSQNDLYNLFTHKADRVKNIAGKKFINDIELVDFIAEWSFADFLPSPDNYFGKCVDIAKRIANGERIFLGI
ncbi:MAG TPA: hypothetical protein PLB61_06745 [Bacteroidales bacterium]|nr:hypothetical protein [Bacteroidales bacterium]HPB57869.1 hypothetical protein [Bacteroidales bacterium]HPZ04371.1 hypothetical protein [Bacteroidales bacterium]